MIFTMRPKFAQSRVGSRKIPSPNAPGNMRVLIADDCPVIRMRLKKHLVDWGFQPVIASDGIQALAALTSKYAPRLAILDWMMPGMDGPTVTQRIREAELGPYTYVVMLTSKSDPADLVSAFATGIDDFLTKPFNEEELHQRLRAGQRIIQLQDQLNDTLVQMKFQATHDSLTGMWNRKSILKSLDRELNRARRNQHSVEATSIVMLDIDHFKRINDLHGHVAGDAVLSAAGDVIKKSLRSYDYVGRYGGEEFMIIMPTTEQDQAKIIAERIRNNIGNANIAIGNTDISVTASLGVATAKIDDTVEDLVNLAEDAMSEAKRTGRNQCVYVEEMVAEEMGLLTKGSNPLAITDSNDPAAVLETIIDLQNDVDASSHAISDSVDNSTSNSDNGRPIQ